MKTPIRRLDGITYWVIEDPKRQWNLRKVDMGQIKLDPQTMNYRNVEGGYVFQESLAKRSQELKETVERFAVVIWPLVVKEKGFMLV